MGFLVKITNLKRNNIEVFISSAIEKIIDGKVIAFPTNSVYGIGGDPYNIQLIEKLYQIKLKWSI